MAKDRNPRESFSLGGGANEIFICCYFLKTTTLTMIHGASSSFLLARAPT